MFCGLATNGGKTRAKLGKAEKSRGTSKLQMIIWQETQGKIGKLENGFTLVKGWVLGSGVVQLPLCPRVRSSCLLGSFFRTNAWKGAL